MSAFKGKVILITGASAGIGEGIALHFATLGVSLALTGRNRENLTGLPNNVKNRGCQQRMYILAITGDINSETDRKAIVNDTLRKFGKIHVLINNAGMTHFVQIKDVTPKQYVEMFDTNCRSHLFLTQLFLPHLVQAKGNIINISSICGSCAMPQVGVYCMTKASLEMFTKCLALELASKGVQVNAVSPGSVVSMITRRSHGLHQDETKYKEYIESCNLIHPVGRVGLPSDIATSVEFLASDQSSFVTGQILCVDGGRSLVSQ